MQDHSDLARQGDLRPFRTSPLGNVYPPAFALGTVINLRQTASSRTIASTVLCSFSYSVFKATRAESIAPAMRSKGGLARHQLPNPRLKSLAPITASNSILV